MSRFNMRDLIHVLAQVSLVLPGYRIQYLARSNTGRASKEQRIRGVDLEVRNVYQESQSVFTDV